MNVDKVTTIRLPRILDERGNLSVFENDQYFPFTLQQVSWLCTNEGDFCEADLAWETSGRIMIVFTGSLKLGLTDNTGKQELILDSDCNCIYIPPFTECRILESANDTIAFLASNEMTEIPGNSSFFFSDKNVINEGYELFD